MIIINIIVREANEKQVEKVAKKYKISKDIIRFLLGRNVSEDLIPLLISKEVLPLLPNNSITNVDKAAHLINSYLIDNNASIYIFGDYDSDGVNSTYIMYNALIELAEALDSTVSVNYYLPERTEGYGLNMDWCKTIVLDNNKTLVITVDNGITKREEIEYLQANKIEVLVTDHHKPQEGMTPNTLIVDAHLNDTDDINGCGLCGAAVAYKVIAYLYQDIYQYDFMYVEKYISHVGIATITDVMPLTEENIKFVNNALAYLNEYPYSKRDYWPVTESMYYFAEMNKKSNIKPKDISFGFGPQINSCGRMGDINVAMNFMLSSNDDELTTHYTKMLSMNDERKLKTKIVASDIDTPGIQDLALIAKKENIEGIAGSLASNLCELYEMPVIIFAENEDDDLLTGSARCPECLDIQELFRSSDYIESFGGHACAAGVTIKKDNFDKFVKSFNKAVSKAQVVMPVDDDDTTYVDDILTTSDINRYTITKYDSVLFFNEFKRPVYYLDKIQIKGYHLSKNNPDNICFHIKNGSKEVKLWCWGFRKTFEAMGCPTCVNIIGSLEVFNGMFVVDIQQIETV